MKLEFSADRVPGPRGSRIEYFMRKPRDRFVAATSCLTGITFLANSWILWPTNRGRSIGAMAMGLIALVAAVILWRKGSRKGGSLGLRPRADQAATPENL
jgi:hypothetical protein